MVNGAHRELDLAPRQARCMRAHARVIAAILLCALSGTSAAARLRAKLERTTIAANETVRLVIELDEQNRGRDPNLRSLSEDFEVLGTSTSSQVQFVNGRQTASTRWIVELAPRQSGSLTVPAVTLDALSTAPLRLSVRAVPKTAGQSAQQVFLRSEISPSIGYVRAQLNYVLRLYMSITTLQGDIQDPVVENDAHAELIRLGKGTTFTEHRDGQAFRVHERRYALFVEQAGLVTLSAPVFRGEIYAAQNTTGIGRLFSQGRRIQVQGKPMTVEVKAAPKGYDNGRWTPSAELKLEEAWSRVRFN